MRGRGVAPVRIEVKGAGAARAIYLGPDSERVDISMNTTDNQTYVFELSTRAAKQLRRGVDAALKAIDGE